MTQLGSMYPLPTVSAVAQAVSRAVGVSVSATLGGAAPVPDPAEDVRNLFSANGGDFTGTMLDFGKAGRLYSDFNGTEAGDGDTLALVLDDQRTDLGTTELVTNGSNLVDTTGWLSDQATLSAESGRLRVTNTGTFGEAYQSVSTKAGRVLRIRVTAIAGTANASVFVSNAAPNTTQGGYNTNFGAWLGSAAGTRTLDKYIVANSDTIFIRLETGTSTNGLYSEYEDISIIEYAESGAYQSSAASRPTVTTDPFGTLVAQPDGTDDFMDLPDGVLGDGTNHVHVFAAYALDTVNSGSAPMLVGFNASTEGIELQHSDGVDAGYVNSFRDGPGTSYSRGGYLRAPTSNEPVIRGDVVDPAGDAFIRVSGVEVHRRTHGFTSIDDPGAQRLFGRGTVTNTNLAGTCHGIVILTGSRAMTAEEIATVEAYLADLASDTLLTADADTVLSRFFRPATDLNVDDGFDPAVWDDSASNGTSTVTVTPGVGLTFNYDGSNPAVADRAYRVRVGYSFSISVGEQTGTVLYRIGTTEGGTDIANAISAPNSTEFVATTDTVYVRVYSLVDGSVCDSVTLTEISATGDYWDLLDDTRMYADDQGTLVEAEGTVQTLLPKGRADLYGPELVANGDFATGDLTGWTEDANNEATVSAGVLSWSSQILGVYQQINVTAGHTHKLTVGTATGSETRVLIRNGRTSGTIHFFAVVSSGETIFFTPDQSTVVVSLNTNNTSASGTFDNVSVKEVLGYPLRQTSAASRPLLSYAPNALLQSIAFYGKDTTTGSIVGTDLVTNGTFDTDTSGWSASASASLSVVGGQMRITTSGTSQYAYQALTTVVGQTYSVEYDYEVNNSANGMDAYAANTINNGISNIATAFHANAATGSGRLVFEATATTTYLHFKARSVGDIDVDNISCTPALADASGNNAGPVVYGTLSRTAVATGANVVAYDGFSASNYLESADDYLAPGTGDWSFTRVVRGAASNGLRVFEYGQPDGVGGWTGPIVNLQSYLSNGVKYRAIISDDGAATFDAILGTALAAGASDPYDVITVVRRGSVIELWVNGELDASGTLTNATGSLTNAGGTVRTGISHLDSSIWPGEISSIMLDANYAPTEAEIQALHADLAAIHSGENADFTYARLTFDGTDDYFEAVDPDGDLAITGDLTILAGVEADAAGAGNRGIVYAGEATYGNNTPYALFHNSGENLALQVRDGSGITVNFGSTASLTNGQEQVVSVVRESGVGFDAGIDIETVETVSDTTVDGASNAADRVVEVGSLGTANYYQGSILQLAIIDRPLSTGLLLHAERALQDKLS